MMDPFGFALENFDAVGAWRTTDAGGAIDPSSRLADGTKIDGPWRLRQTLLRRPDAFVATMTEKLLTYALGRGLEYYDRPAVRGHRQECEPREFPFLVPWCSGSSTAHRSR